MADAHVGLAWWPPSPDEWIGEEPAQELIASLKRIAGPVVDDAEADFRHRANPGTKFVWSGSPANSLARCRFGPEMHSSCVGAVDEAHSGDAQQHPIQPYRHGVLQWRRH